MGRKSSDNNSFGRPCETRFRKDGQKYLLFGSFAVRLCPFIFAFDLDLDVADTVLDTCRHPIYFHNTQIEKNQKDTNLSHGLNVDVAKI